MAAQIPQANAPKTPDHSSQSPLQGFTGSLRGRLILALAAAAIVPTAISGFLGSNLTQARNRQTSLNQLEITSLQASALTDGFLDEVRTFPRLISESGLFLDALKESNQQVEAEGLTSLPPKVVDERFAETQVLQVRPELNKFLQAIVASSKVSEVIVTERHGINIALSGRASDVVQSDEDWWQKTSSVGKSLVREPQFDESTGIFAVEITDVIRDPSNGALLGISEVSLPADTLKISLETLLKEQELAEGSARVESIQLLNAYTELGKPLVTIGTGSDLQGEDQQVIGGDRIKKAAVYLRRVQSITAITPEEASDELANTYGVTPLLVERHDLIGKSTILAIFEDGDRVYSVAAVRGAPWVALTSTAKTTIAAAGQDLNRVFAITGAILAVVAAAAALLLARQLSQPLTQLSAAAQKVAAGDLDVRAAATGTAETQTLAGSFNNLVVRVQGLLNAQQKKSERDRLFANLALVTDPDELEAPLNAAMARLREDLGSDRTVVYRFTPDGSGYIAAEDVLPGWPVALGNEVFDACIPQETIEAYRQGRIVATEDVFGPGFCTAPEHIALMERLKIKSSLIVPIVSGEVLYGLLIAHHCQGKHAWTEGEISYFKESAEQIGGSLGGLIVSEQQAAAAEEQRRQREELEESVVALMSDIEGAADGDLTVRAKLMAGDMGIVADLFNAVVENLQETAQQVKESAGQVSSSLGTNEGAIRTLADKAISEATEIRSTLGSIEQMNQSILNVADTAGQAAAIANDAFATARDGNSAMEQTVQGVLNLRSTIGETAKKMKRLGESAQKISQVVSLIDEIALKTNLLAINASVEANRAGEMGQGFTAVAQQVGSLAEQSAAAAKEIARSIAEIQLETQEAIAAMEQGTVEVVDNTRLVETTKERLAEVLNKSQEIDNLMRSISTATTSQAETSQVVATLMQQVTAPSEERSASSRQVAEAMQSTAAVAQSLQSSVEQFKVEKAESV